MLFQAPHSTEPPRPPPPRHPRTSPVCRGDQLDVRPIHGQTADKGSDNSSLKSCILIDAGPRGPLPPCLFQGPRCGWMSCRHAACTVALVRGMESLT